MSNSRLGYMAYSLEETIFLCEGSFRARCLNVIMNIHQAKHIGHTLSIYQGSEDKKNNEVLWIGDLNRRSQKQTALGLLYCQMTAGHMSQDQMREPK